MDGQKMGRSQMRQLTHPTFLCFLWFRVLQNMPLFLRVSYDECLSSVTMTIIVRLSVCNLLMFVKIYCCLTWFISVVVVSLALLVDQKISFNRNIFTLIRISLKGFTENLYSFSNVIQCSYSLVFYLCFFSKWILCTLWENLLFIGSTNFVFLLLLLAKLA